MFLVSILKREMELFFLIEILKRLASLGNLILKLNHFITHAVILNVTILAKDKFYILFQPFVSAEKVYLLYQTLKYNTTGAQSCLTGETFLP